MRTSSPRHRDPWGRRPLLLGVVHLAPLPGAPRAATMSEVLSRASEDAAAFAEAGFDGVVVENYGDAPFFAGAVPPETVASMTVASASVRRALPRGLLAGVNVLRNDALAAVAIAAAVGLDFVRVNVLAGAVVADQGVLQTDAARVVRARAHLAPDVRILADVHVKHAAPLAPRPIEDEAKDLVDRGGADALVVTGPRTGAPASAGDLRAVRAAVPRALLLVGSGVSQATVRDVLRLADGAIVGTSVKRGGRTEAPVDRARARALVRAAREE